MSKQPSELLVAKNGSIAQIAITKCLTISSKRQPKWYLPAKNVKKFSERISSNFNKQINIAHIVIINTSLMLSQSKTNDPKTLTNMMIVLSPMYISFCI